MPAVAAWNFTQVFRVLSTGWLLGTVFMLLQHLGTTLRAAAWHRRLRRPWTSELSLLPASASSIPLKVFIGQGSPCVSGLWRPVVAASDLAFAELTPDQWLWVLRHEEEHRRSADPLVAWTLGWLRCAFWWNLFFHGLISQWTQAREEICDAAAVKEGAERCSYAELLLTVAATTSCPVPCILRMAASQPARRLRARITAVLSGQRVAPATGWLFRLAYAIPAGALLLILGGTGFAEPAKPTVELAAAVEDTGELFTRTFKVRPDFLTASGTLKEKKTAQEILASLGVNFPEDATAVFVPSTSQLIVKNTVTQLKKVEEVLEEYFNRTPLQVYVTTKWVEINTDLSKGPAEVLAMMDRKTLPSDKNQTLTLTDPQFQLVIRALAQRKGVDLLSGPSVTTRFGQKAIVEVVREIKGPPQFIDPAGSNFLGIRTDVEVALEKSALKVAVTGEMRGLSGKTFIDAATMAKNGELPPDAKLVKVQKSAAITISNGHTVCLNMGETEPGRKVLLFVTATIISPTGKPTTEADIKRESERKPLPVSLAPPLKGAPVEVSVQTARINGILSNASLFDLLVPAAPNANPEPEKGTKIPQIASQPEAELPFEHFTILGVFTAKQAEVVLRSIRLNARKEDLREQKETSSANQPELTFPLMKDTGSKIIVRPTASLNDDTIDLIIEPRHDSLRSITTSVTVWNEQTVAFGRAVKEGSKTLGEVFFVTVKKKQ